MRFVLPTTVLAVLAVGLFFLSRESNSFQISMSYEAVPTSAEVNATDMAKNIISDAFDEPNQKPLDNPSKEIKAIYATSWSAGNLAKMNYLTDLIKKTELNAIVIDIKDYSGTVTYDTKAPEAIKYGARAVRIPKINSLVKRLHDAGIYVIGRITIFQDPILAKARPGLVIKNSKTGGAWKDNKGLSWIDPGSMEAWDYNVSIAKDAVERGFDEINFDYIRFPSDGDLAAAEYPFTDLKKTTRAKAIERFFQYLRTQLAGVKISADLFGLTTINADDLGIGQVIGSAYENFDYVAPMVYPSHYATGFLNFKNPADHPYEVVENSMEHAFARLIKYQNGYLGEISNVARNQAKLRPWLQDFNLGAVYGAEQVKAQVKAIGDAFCKAIGAGSTETASPAGSKQCDMSLSNQVYGGWMLWDPANNYTRAALNAK